MQPLWAETPTWERRALTRLGGGAEGGPTGTAVQAPGRMNTVHQLHHVQLRV